MNTTRTDRIRRELSPLRAVLSAQHDAMLDELLDLAAVGDRAQAFLTAFAGARPFAPVARGGKATSKRKPAAPPAAKTACSRGGPSLRDAILQDLRAAGKPVAIADLTKAVRAAGYVSASPNFSVIVGNTVVKLPEAKRAGRGVYALARPSQPA
jgi:hypothetical protein